MAQLNESGRHRTFRALLALAVVGSFACEEKTPVPFKRSEGVALDPSPTAAQKGPSEPRTQALPIESTSHPEGTQRVVLAGHALERAQGSYRASLLLDLDADGAHEAVLLASDERGRPQLEVATLGGTMEAPHATVPLLEHALACSVGATALTAFAPELLLAAAELACAPTAAAIGAASDPSASAESPVHLAPPPSLHRYVLSAELNPRLLLHVAVRPARGEEPKAELELALTSQDLDADEHADVRVRVRATLGGESTAHSLDLDFLSRPSGFAREPDEPERTIAALSREALDALARKPERALELADQALLLHQLLCRESQMARLVVDGQLGVSCGRSLGAGRALAVRALVLAKRRAVLAALEAESQLSAAHFRIEPGLSTRVKRALAELPGETSFAWHAGPPLETPEGPAVRLPAVAFVDEDRVLLRGSLAKEYDLRSFEQTPVSASGSVLVSDPASRLVITDLVRECDGLRLVAVPEGKVVMGVVASSGATEVPFARKDVVDPGCSTRDRTRESGFVVLGASPQGAVVAAGAKLFVVPLLASSGPARTLGADESAPTLLHPGALSADGLSHVLLSSQGLLVVRRGPAASVTLVRPPASCTAAPSDAAISPSGRKLAMLCGGRLYVARDTRDPIPVAAAGPSGAWPSGPETVSAPQPTAAPNPLSQAAAPPALEPLPSPPRNLLDLPPPEPEHFPRR